MINHPPKKSDQSDAGVLFLLSWLFHVVAESLENSQENPVFFPCSGERQTFLLQHAFQLDIDYHYWFNALRISGFLWSSRTVPGHWECAARTSRRRVCCKDGGNASNKVTLELVIWLTLGPVTCCSNGRHMKFKSLFLFVAHCTSVCLRTFLKKKMLLGFLFLTPLCVMINSEGLFFLLLSFKLTSLHLNASKLLHLPKF